jgi:hypothetical protein
VAVLARDCGGLLASLARAARAADPDVAEQAAWALGNIAGDTATGSSACFSHVANRDRVISAGGFDAVLDGLGARFAAQLDAPGAAPGEGAALPLRASLGEVLAFTLGNCCRGKPRPDFETVRRALPCLAGVVEAGRGNAPAEACWALSHLADGPNDQIEAALETRTPSGVPLVQAMVKLMDAARAGGDNPVLQPALRVLGNLVTGDDDQTQQAVDCGAVQGFVAVLRASRAAADRKEALWSLSNIAAGNREQIQVVLDTGAVGLALEVLRSADGEPIVGQLRRRLAWAAAAAEAEAMAELPGDGPGPPGALTRHFRFPQ